MVMPDHSGRRVGGFELIEPLASGGFATVYRARQVRLDREVAVKVLDPALARDPEIASRFEREGRAAASLDHPAVVPVYEAGEDDGLVYLAMRLVEGETLDELLLRGGPLTTARTVSHIEPVAEALDHAHERGLIHRDVKPSNIFIDGRRVWLGDFGIAATADQIGHYTTGALGTAHYMAPEQASQGDLDGRADLYALGCVVHRCLTGRPPYDRGELVATLVAHVNDPVPETGHTALDRFLATALAKAPEDRFARGADLVASLRSVGPVDSLEASPSGRADGVTGGSPPKPAPPTTAQRSSVPAAAPAPADSAPLPPPVAAAPAPVSDSAPEPAPTSDIPSAPPAPRQKDVSVRAADATTAQPPSAPPAGLTAPHGAAVPPVQSQSSSADSRSGGRRKGMWLGAAALAVVAILAVGAWQLLGSDDDGGAVLDGSGEVTVGEPIPVGDTPLAVGIADGSVFVANVGDETITQVPTDDSPPVEIDEIRARPLDIDGGDGLVWVTTNDPTRAVVRLNLSTTGVAAVDLGFEASRVVADGDGVWISDPDGGQVVHLDDSGSQDAMVTVAGAPTDLVLAAGSLWVSDPSGDTVVQIDMAAGTVLDTIQMDVGVGPIAASDDAVYVVDRDGATLTRVDMGDTTSQVTVGVAERPTRPEVGAGGLWLVSPDTGNLYQFDLGTLAETQVVDIGGGPGGLAIDGDNLWVTRSDADELVRVTATP